MRVTWYVIAAYLGFCSLFAGCSSSGSSAEEVDGNEESSTSASIPNESVPDEKKFSVLDTLTVEDVDKQTVQTSASLVITAPYRR